MIAYSHQLDVRRAGERIGSRTSTRTPRFGAFARRQLIQRQRQNGWDLSSSRAVCRTY
jgi:hypothetical protein